MNFNEIEQKLIRLGLGNGAHEGEIANAASALFRQLRKRQITAEQFLNGSGSNTFAGSMYEGMYRQSEAARRHVENDLRNIRMENSEFVSKMRRQQNEIAALQAIIEAAKKAGVNVGAAASAASTSSRRTYTPREKTGAGLLSERERQFFTAVGNRAAFRGGSENLTVTLYQVGRCKAEHGMIQIFLRKGLLEKRGYCRHGLTEKGVEYFRQYCR